MIADEEICRLIAAREGLPTDFIVKEIYLMRLLGELSRIGATKNIIFKGGTALNKVYLQKDYRFSEDVDFDFSGKDWANHYTMLKEGVAGFEGSEARYLRAARTYQIDYLYKIPAGRKDRVRLDVNIGIKIKGVDKIVQRDVTSRFIGETVRGIQTYGFEDLLARKMHALGSRAEGKDLYDVYNAIDMANKPKLVKAMSYTIAAYSEPETAEQFLENIIQKLSGTDYRKVRDLTNPYIPIRSRPSDWSMVIDTLIEKLKILREFL